MVFPLRINTDFTYREQVSRNISWGHRFLFLNILFSCLIGSAYVYAAPETDNFFAFIYLCITWIGQMSFLTFVIYLVILFPLSFIGQFRIYRVLAVITAVCCDTVLLFDAKLFLAIKVHASTMVLGMIFRDLDFKTGLNYNFLYIAVPTVLAAQYLFARLSTRWLYHRGHSPAYKAVIGVCLLSFLGSHSVHIWADANRYEAIQVLRSVFPAHYPMTARSFLSGHGWLDETMSQKSDAEDPVTYPLSRIEAQPSSLSRSVLMIAVNGLSYSDLNLEDTPGLMQIKQMYQSFEQCYLPYAELRDNIFAATWGLPVEYRAALRQSNTFPVTVEEMHHQDYAIRLITDDISVFDRQDLQNVMGSTRLSALEEVKSPAAAVDAALTALTTAPQGQPFTMFVSLNGLNHRNLSADARKKLLKNTDAQLVRFLDEFRQSAHMDNTLIVFTSLSGNPGLAENTHGAFSRERQKIPLLIIWPHGENRSVSTGHICSVFDFPATLGAEILGITSPAAAYSVGDSLFNLPERQFFVTTSAGTLLLIGPRSVTTYARDGRSFIENYGMHLPVEPNLKNLIRAMRILNRFKQ